MSGSGGLFIQDRAFEMSGSNGAESGRHASGRFLPGHRSTGGRKVGSRNRLSEQFLQDLQTEWKRSGKKVLQRVAEEAPETFLRVVGAILPKALEVGAQLSVSTRTELAVEIADFATAYEKWGKFLGARMPTMIEAGTIEHDESEIDETDDEQSSNGR
jgi:hypothetical protein